jgi:DnaJ-class molecular chaperone
MGEQPAFRANERGPKSQLRMKTRVANPNEKRCPACDGTGVTAATQPVQPGRRIYRPPCGECGGKGRIPKADS